MVQIFTWVISTYFQCVERATGPCGVERQEHVVSGAFWSATSILIGAIKVPFPWIVGLEWEKRQGPVPGPRNPFPGFVLFPVVHTLGNTASSDRASYTFDAGHPALYYEFPEPSVCP